MNAPHWNLRFLRSTRGRILTLLREQLRTVDELAQALGLTGNAVRAHLAALERDGLIEQRDIRRGPSKPSHVYGLTQQAEQLFSRAYEPVLSAMLAELVERDGDEAAGDVLRQVGHRLAREKGMRPVESGGIAERLAPAIALITELGGATETEIEGNTFRVRGHGCPLAAITSQYEIACQAIGSLMSDITGVPIEVQCDQSDHPRCCFVGTFEALPAGQPTESSDD